MARLTIHPGNDMVLEFDAGLQPDGIDGLVRDEISGNTVDAATVEITLKDLAGNTITDTDASPVTWPLNLPAVVGQGGNYRVTLPDTLDVAAHQELVGNMTIDNGPGARYAAELRIPVDKRYE